MGVNSSCQEEWCVRPAEMFCECVKKSYCSACFTKHMSSTSTSHNAYSLTTSSESLSYKSLKYLKSDRSTEVYEGLHKKASVIIKVQYFTSKSDLNRKQEEAALQRSSKHPHICRCLKSYIDESYKNGFKFVMIMEKAIKDLDQEIQDRIQDMQYWTESEIWAHLLSLVDALAFMQCNNLTHRDIKPANILLFANQILKLADFGLSIEEEDLKNNVNLGVVGTVMYLSPKLMMAYDDIQKGKNSTGLVNHNPYKSDIYSLGLTFLYMASLEVPSGLNYNIEGTNYLHHKIKRAIKEIPYSQDFKNILSKMLEVDEENRVDFIEIQQLIKNESPKIEPEIVSFGVSEINAFETSTNHDFLQTSVTLAEILNDPFLPIPIKSAISKISLTKSMVLSHTLMPNEAEYLKIAINGSNLLTLDLADCNLGYKGLKIIIETDLSSIENLSLGNNSLGKRGAKLLMRNFARLCNLKVLRLWSNRFTDKGIALICETLPAKIEELFLADNQVTEEGAKNLARKMPLNLKILSLPDNKIGDKGARAISIALSKLNTILHLYLDNNGIGPIGVKYLISYLPICLKSLRIIGNEVPENMKQSLASCKFKVAI